MTRYARLNSPDPFVRARLQAALYKNRRRRLTRSEGGGGVVLPYRQVATRCAIPVSFVSANKYAMSRQSLFTRAAVSSLKAIFPNFYGGTFIEAAPGAASTITAAIEYPAGVFTQLTFSGSATGTVPNGGMLASDEVAISIPDDTEFFVRYWINNAAGVLLSNANAGYIAGGDRLTVSASALTDQTMGGTVTNTTGAYYVGPCAVVSRVAVNAVALVGDSKVGGFADTAGASRDVGELARSIGPALPYINLGINGSRANNWAGNNTNRLALSAYCTHAVLQHGYNDVFISSASAATIVANLQTIRADIGLPAWAVTKTPQTTSTDSWATTANQTVKAREAERVSLNALIRAGLSGFAGYFEIADPTESARDSGLWRAPGFTADGLHETATGYAAIVTAAAIDPAVFV